MKLHTADRWVGIKDATLNTYHPLAAQRSDSMWTRLALRLPHKMELPLLSMELQQKPLAFLQRPPMPHLSSRRDLDLDSTQVDDTPKEQSVNGMSRY
jgi:hypothetical protein